MEEEKPQSAQEFFSFPFTPYDVQESLMRSLYETLQESKVGIFESPTGTGKSLSLICSSLTWLKEHQRRRKEQLQSQLNDYREDENRETDDWFSAQTKSKATNEKLDIIRKELDQISNQENRFKEIKKRLKSHEERKEGQLRKLMNSAKKFKEDEEESEEDLLPENDEEEPKEDQETQEDKEVMKIYYCSRTHSQLAQFARELQKTSFAENTRVTTLGSRLNLCINESVKRLGNLSLINEKCVDMQKNDKKNLKEAKGSKCGKCKFYRRHNLEDMSDKMLSKVMDIEECVQMGRDLKGCPYYGSRHAVPEAELVLLPYNILLHKSTRDACRIQLQGNIVIVDEAHNLLESLSSMYSVQVNKGQLEGAHYLLTEYLERYRSRLNPLNLMYIKQILFILKSFIGFLDGKNVEVIYGTIEFLEKTSVDNINLFKVIEYCQRSKISRKLQGFSRKSPEKLEGCPFPVIQEFLSALTSPNKEGRLSIFKDPINSNQCLKFFLLSPNRHFFDVVNQARSVILAGGTMHPVEHFSQALFEGAGLGPDKITNFTCGHVIPKENLLPLVLESGPGNVPFDFTFSSRSKPELLDDLGRLVVNLCSVVPGGIVLFFPSYEMERLVHSRWETSGMALRISNKKRIFREPKNSNQVDGVLEEYARAVDKRKVGNPQTGAILLSVVGGKMSEGINFSDQLGRCVILVGLPYPNIHSLQLKEKIKHQDRLCSSGGREYCQTLCMRSVNQSIGRAIRHSGDYAAILLLDLRYNKTWVQQALPQWISQQLQSHSAFPNAFSALRNFFASKRNS